MSVSKNRYKISSDISTRRMHGAGKGIAFVICGPSGAGKNSVIKRVMEILPGLSFSVSYTTRPRRAEEHAGVDYNYISQQEFDRLIADGELIEHVTYLGDRYGTSRAQIEEVFIRGEDVILNIDVTGARRLRQKGLVDFPAVYIFLTPSSLDQLHDRLKIRGTEDKNEIKRRLNVAKEEMDALWLFDYLVINDEFEVAVDELRSIIITERCRLVDDHG
ncbi:MAG: guanylate kinase [Candidatus Bipolaricaulota bacterium]|nr:guanylate kinase [Candidatus Bipolaricaulota bacterium]